MNEWMNEWLMTSCLSVCLYLLLCGCQLVEQSFMFLHLWRHSSQILRHVIRNALQSLLQSERLHICVYVWMDDILTDTAPGWESVRQSGPGKSSDIPPLSAADPDAPWPRPSNPPSMHCRQTMSEWTEGKTEKRKRNQMCRKETKYDFLYTPSSALMTAPPPNTTYKDVQLFSRTQTKSSAFSVVFVFVSVWWTFTKWSENANVDLIFKSSASDWERSNGLINNWLTH